MSRKNIIGVKKNIRLDVKKNESSVKSYLKAGRSMTGINPRHKQVHLSLLPSGPDEVRDCLLHGDRSEHPAFK